MNVNNQPEYNFGNNTNINPNNINNNLGGSMEEDEKKIYTNADLVKLLKLSKLVNRNENNLQNPPHPSVQQPPQTIPIQQAVPIMMPYPAPTQQMPYHQMPYQPPQQTPQGNLNFIDREEIRSMISRYSEDTENLLKNYVKANNEKMIKYVKEMLEYKQTMNSLVKAAQEEDVEEEPEEAPQNNTAAPIINAINSIPKQIGSVFKSVSGAVGNVVNSANQTILGKKPENTNTNETDNEKQIDNGLKNNTPMTNTPTNNMVAKNTPNQVITGNNSNLTEPKFEPVSDDEVANEKKEKERLAQAEMKKVESEVSNIFGTNKKNQVNGNNSSRLQSGGGSGSGSGKIKKISRKKSKKNNMYGNQKTSRVRVKK